MNRDTVGDYFLRNDGTLWRQVSFTDEPTARLERVGADGRAFLERTGVSTDGGIPYVDSEKIDVVTSSSIAETFSRLGRRATLPGFAIDPDVLRTLTPEERRVADLLIAGGAFVRDES